MQRKVEAARDEILLVGTIKKHFRASPDLKPLCPYVRGGIRLFNYLFEAQKAAETGLPKSYTLKPIEVETSSKRGDREIRVVEWICKILTEQLKPQAEYPGVTGADKCPKCGAELRYCAQGEYCSRTDCTYVL